MKPNMTKQNLIQTEIPHAAKLHLNTDRCTAIK